MPWPVPTALDKVKVTESLTVFDYRQSQLPPCSKFIHMMCPLPTISISLLYTYKLTWMKIYLLYGEKGNDEKAFFFKFVQNITI